MRDGQAELCDLTGRVYDAALDQSLWPDVVGRSADFVGGTAATFLSQDPVAEVGKLHCAVRIDPHYQQLYLDKYATLDPAPVKRFLTEIEQPVAAADLIPELPKTRFYREWMRPQGIVDWVSAVIEKSATSVTKFAVIHLERNGLVDVQTQQRMRLIVPHIRRALLISRLLDLKARQSASFADTLDGLDAGMYLVDAHGRLIHANAAGNAILDAGDLLSAPAGRLVGCEAQADRTLQEVFAAAAEGDAALGIKGIAVPLIGKHGERYVAHALPLTSGARRRSSIVFGAAVVLFVRKVALAASLPKVIGATFKLTPTELRVLLAMVELGGVPQVATTLGVGRATVRTHVNRLFRKTGVARQADLVKLVAGYATPLRE
jgi:DNA-binding CsgD family transcriptional regulator/PAS domain-containing protein